MVRHIIFLLLLHTLFSPVQPLHLRYQVVLSPLLFLRKSSSFLALQWNKRLRADESLCSVMVVIHHWDCTRESEEGWETPGVARGERERGARIAWQSWEPHSLFLHSPLCCLPFFEPLCVKLMAAKWPAAMVHLCWKWRKQCEANALMIWLINCLLYLIDHKAAEQRFTSSDACTTKPQLVVREIVSGLMLTFKHCDVFHFSQENSYITQIPAPSAADNENKG